MPKFPAVYDTLLNGQIHRLVRGVDFDTTPLSLRGALYARAEAFGCVVDVDEQPEGDQTVVYVKKRPKRPRRDYLRE